MRLRYIASSIIISLPLFSCGDKEEKIEQKIAASNYPATPADFLRSAKNGDLQSAQSLIKKDIDLNTTDNDGYTALHLAAANNYTEIVSLLINAGIKVDTPSKDNTTPLMSAAQKGHSEIVSQLLTEGAQPERKDDENRSPLILAIEGNHVDSVAALAPYSRNQLDTALLYASSQGKYQVIETLTSAGASLYVRHEGGMTPLMLAAQNGHTATVYTLLENGANRYAINEHGWTASQVATSANQELIANILNEAPKDEDFAINEPEDVHGIQWPDPSIQPTPSSLTTLPTITSNTTIIEKPTNFTETPLAGGEINPAPRPKAAKKKTLRLPFISGKTISTTDLTKDEISTDFKMLDYQEKPLPLIVDKTTHQNNTKHAEIRILYGSQETVTLKEGDNIPDTRFKITSINRKFHDSKITDGQPADISTVEIEDTSTGKRRQMTAQIPASAIEPWAVLRSQSSGETYAVRAGQRFQTSTGQPFTISDVRPNQIVITQDDTGEAMTIPLGR